MKIKLHCLIELQGDILSMIEQETDCKGVELDIKLWLKDKFLMTD